MLKKFRMLSYNVATKYGQSFLDFTNRHRAVCQRQLNFLLFTDICIGKHLAISTELPLQGQRYCTGGHFVTTYLCPLSRRGDRACIVLLFAFNQTSICEVSQHCCHATWTFGNYKSYNTFCPLFGRPWPVGVFANSPPCKLRS